MRFLLQTKAVRLPLPGARVLAACLVLALAAGASVGQEEPASADGGTEPLEVRELKTALDRALAENAEMRRLLDAAEMQRRVLVESLSEAVRVSEEQVASTRELRLKIESFGVDLFNQEEGALEQRLLKAVRDLDISRQEERRRGEALHRLSEAFLTYLAATSDAPAAQRETAETAIRVAGEALVDLPDLEGGGAALAAGRSRVVSIDTEIGLVVFDAGRRTGLRVGTPVAVLRGEQPIYSAMVVDVRQSIAGAVLQERLVEGEDVAVGDVVELLPTDAEF